MLVKNNRIKISNTVYAKTHEIEHQRHKALKDKEIGI